MPQMSHTLCMYHLVMMLGGSSCIGLAGPHSHPRNLSLYQVACQCGDLICSMCAAMPGRSDDFCSTDRHTINTPPLVRLPFHCVNFEPGPALCVQQQLNIQTGGARAHFLWNCVNLPNKEFLTPRIASTGFYGQAVKGFRYLQQFFVSAWVRIP